MYADRVIAGLKTGTFSCVAHPDLMPYRGDASVYRYHMQRMCETAAALSVPLEINMQGMSAGKRYPQPAFWEIAGEVGNDVIIGADAHTAQQLENVEIYDKCMELVRRYHLHLIGDLNG